MEALEGLLVGLSKLVNDKGDAIQPQRAHYFFRNVEGLWACSNAYCNEVDDRFKYPNRFIGKLYRKPQVSCKCGSVILEVLLCRQCGEIYLGGWEKKEGSQSFLSMEKESYLESSNYYSVYPITDDATSIWQKCNLNNISGELKRTVLGTNLVFVRPDGYPLQYPNHCYNCDYTENIRNKGTLTPIFKHYTGVQKVNQLMADSLMLTLDKFKSGGDKPKLVLFSDSRQAAAKLAAGIEMDHYRDEIFFRILNKEILNQAFSGIILIDSEKTDNVHGEFGKYFNWKNYKSGIQKWIDENNDKIIDISSHLRTGTFILKNDAAVYQEIKNKLVKRIDEVVNNEHDYTQIALSERLANAGYLPMFGFPTKLRVLYESKPTRLPPQNVIDRNLGMAILEFAPGSEVIKDKKILRPVGVVYYMPRDGSPEEVDGRGILENEISRCTNCNTIFLSEEAEQCSICGSQLHKIKACSPLGFCVEYDLIPEDFDGSFERSPRAGEVTLDPNSQLINSELIKNLLVKSNQVPSEGIVHQINDNDGNLFILGKLRGAFTNRWVVRDQLSNPNTTLIDETGYAFLSSRHTGVITLSLNQIADNYFLNALNPYHKGAFLSWAYLIRKSICDELDIETNEFDIGYRISPMLKTPEVYIVEKADNGAGYCNYLNGTADRDISERVFIKSLLPDGRVFREILMKQEHEKKCASSCYDCLKDYYNQQHHGLLNWRVALDLAALANKENTVLDFSQVYWKEYICDTLLATLENKLNGKRKIIDENIIINAKDISYLIIHPFWNEFKVQSIRNGIGGIIVNLNIMDAIAKSRF